MLIISRCFRQFQLKHFLSWPIMVADIFDKLLVRMDPCLISKSMKSLALLNLENYNFAYRNLNIHKIKKKTVTVNKILKASHIVNIYSSMGNLKKNCNHIPKLGIGQYLFLFIIRYDLISVFVTIRYYFTHLQ